MKRRQETERFVVNTNASAQKRTTALIRVKNNSFKLLMEIQQNDPKRVLLSQTLLRFNFEYISFQTLKVLMSRKLRI